LDADRTGYVDIPHSLRRQRALLLEDVNTIREYFTSSTGRRSPAGSRGRRMRGHGRGSPALTTAGTGS